MRRHVFATLSLTALTVAAFHLSPIQPANAQSAFTPDTLGKTQALSLDPWRGVLTMAPLLETVNPAIVSLEVITRSKPPQLSELQREMFERRYGHRPEQREGPARQSGGSGVIIDATKGHIVTNHHVVDGATEIVVVLEDGRRVEAKILGTDDKTDLAVIEIDTDKLVDIKFAPENSYRVGDYVIAIGNPFGFDHTVTSGIISGLGRELAGLGRKLNRSGDYQDFIQTDASINPGNSGGALINSKGELIGINSAIISASGGNNGIGLAVPIHIVNSVVAQLLEYGEVRRGRIGVSIRSIDEALEEALGLPSRNGALVNEVAPDSAAEEAGLEAGDVIVEFNGIKILDSADIRNAVGLVPAGTKTTIKYWRDGKVKTTKITVKAVKEEIKEINTQNEEIAEEFERFEGAIIGNIPKNLETRGGDDGVYIKSVKRFSKAARSGLATGDIIRKVGRQAVTNLAEFESAIKAKKGSIALKVERNGRNIILAVK